MSTSNQKKTTSSPKRASSGRKASSRKKSARKKTEDFSSFHTEVAVWITVAFSALLMLGNFGFCGQFGKVLGSVFFGTFGLIQYIVPVVILLLTGLLLANQFSTLAVKKSLLVILFLCMLSTICQMVTDFDCTSAFGAAGYSFLKHTGGGAIGGGICIFLHKLFGKAGAVLVVVMVSMVSLMLIFEKSVLHMLKEFGAYTAQMSENAKLYKKEQQKRREEEQKREEERQKALEEVLLSREEQNGAQLDETSEERKADGGFYDNLLREDTEPKMNKVKKKFIDIGKKFGLDMGFQKPDEGESEGQKEETEQKQKPEGILGMSDIEGLSEPFTGTFSFADDEPEASGHGNGAQTADGTTQEPEEETDEESAMQASEGSRLAKKAKSASIKKHSAARELFQDSKDTEDVALQDIDVEKAAKKKPHVFPPMNLLSKGERGNSSKQRRLLQETALKLQHTLANFGVNVTITNISCGPSVTRYELQPEQGVKVSKIVGLADDIKLNLAASDIRIEAPIPGKAAIGIEVPNRHNEIVKFRDLIENDQFRDFPSKLAFAVGKDIGGKIVISDIAKMPHLLIAGATGSGKSVCINTLIMSILYKADPEDVKFIMIDPKVVELNTYNGIPHLLIPVVTDPQKAAGALNWAVAEMQERYDRFAQYNVRNLQGYNKKVEEVKKAAKGMGEEMKKYPQIIIIVDELADLMMVAAGEVEGAIVRLSQLARAAGIHLVIATQRPSVNVITGLIKANIPSRIAFAVSSGVDSRTIIDINGAEKLLGRGDMLFYPQEKQKPIRVQGAFISDNEVGKVVDFLKEQTEDDEDGQVVSQQVEDKIESSIHMALPSDDRDEYFVEAAKFIISKDKASIGMIQRMFKVGFNRASRIMEQLADAGIVGPEEGTKPRKILMSEEQLLQYLEQESL